MTTDIPIQDSLDKELDEILAFGYDDPAFIYDVHVLIGGEHKVTEAKDRLKQLMRRERLDELERKLTLHIDEDESSEFHAGFYEAVEQYVRRTEKRIAVLSESEEVK